MKHSTQPHRTTAARRQVGVTLVEATVVSAVVAVLVGTSAPGFKDLRTRQQLQGIATQLETDLHLARAEAVARNEGVRISFSTGGTGGSCYVLHTGAAGACSCDVGGHTTCESGAEAMRSVALEVGYPVQLVSNSRSVLFDAVKGTATPTATIRVSSDLGQVRQIVNVMGRVRSCSPDGAVSGYRRC
jgi:type IV fimbrial biogenesis protein FimT